MGEMTCKNCEFCGFCLQNTAVDVEHPPAGYAVGEIHSELGGNGYLIDIDERRVTHAGCPMCGGRRQVVTVRAWRGAWPQAGTVSGPERTVGDGGRVARRRAPGVPRGLFLARGMSGAGAGICVWHVHQRIDLDGVECREPRACEGGEARKQDEELQEARRCPPWVAALWVVWLRGRRCRA